MLKQKDSIFIAVEAALKNDGQSIEEGVAVALTKDQRSSVVETVTTSLMNGETEMKDSARQNYDTEDKMSSYAKGLVNNWLRKDKRLNGNVKYEAQNPGSRAGSQDPTIRELKKLLANVEDGEQKEAIQQEIDNRLAELKAQKAANRKASINTDLIPEELKHLAI
jgi:hypothetical protein